MADRLELQRIASAFRVVGWGAFWSQLTLALVSAGVLAFNSIGSELVSNRDTVSYTHLTLPTKRIV